VPRAALRRTDFGGLENHFLAAAIALTVAGPSVSAFGQEFRQESIRTPEPPRYQTFAVNPAEPGLFRAGPFSGTGDVALGYSYNDNAATTGTTTTGASKTTGVSKISLNQVFENVDLNLAWVLSPLNRIDLQLDGQLQENFYSNGRQLLNVAIQASQIRFQATVGDVLLQTYEQFSFTQDPVVDPTIAGQTNLNRLTNTMGISASVPLYRAQAGLELDYTYSDILGGGGVASPQAGGAVASQQTAFIKNSLHLGGNFGFEIAPSLTLGVEVNGSHNTGAGSLDTNVISGGGFLRGHLTRLIELDTGAGILIGEGPGVGQPQYYVYLFARHQVSRNLQILVGISRDIEFSSGQGDAVNNGFRIAAQLSASRRWSIVAASFVNFGDVITGTLPGRYTQYGVTLDSSYLLSQHISINLNYRYAKREGEGSSGSYAQNLFGFAVTYKF
jgi:hypothetical protein